MQSVQGEGRGAFLGGNLANVGDQVVEQRMHFILGPEAGGHALQGLDGGMAVVAVSPARAGGRQVGEFLEGGLLLAAYAGEGGHGGVAAPGFGGVDALPSSKATFSFGAG